MIWFLIVLCFLIAFVFSGIEAGILSVNRVRLRHRVKLGDRAALKLNRLLSRPERIMVTVLIVTNLTAILAIILTAQYFVDRLGLRGYGIALLIWLPGFLIGVELLPKSLFRRFPYRALAALADALRVADFLLAPLVILLSRGARLALVGHAVAPRKVFVGREEVKYFIVEGERVGTLSKIEREMIHNIVDFRTVTVGAVMIPFERVKFVRQSATISEAMALSRETHLDRLPVLSAEGKFIGLVDVFETLLDRRPGNACVTDAMEQLLSVGESEPADQVLRKLRETGLGLAAIVDAAGRPLGIVSVEDIVQRLVTTATAEQSSEEKKRAPGS